MAATRRDAPAQSATADREIVISRRCGSAIALKTSDVVAARAMSAIICRYRHASSERKSLRRYSAERSAYSTLVNGQSLRSHSRTASESGRSRPLRSARTHERTSASMCSSFDG